MSNRARVKTSSIQSCINYIREAVLRGAGSVHYLVIGDEASPDYLAYQTTLRNVLKYARQCTKAVMTAGENTGLDKVFQAVYGKTMREYLQECLGEVKENMKQGRKDHIRNIEDAVHCYLGFLTAVEAITPESPSAKATQEKPEQYL
ncbi:MAG: hypothetical protein L7H00_05815 [Vulcanisaeta sp.]|nr:hypothetical protein [Vulcanisaeta sp.]